jgi:hypothetical protein
MALMGSNLPRCMLAAIHTTSGELNGWDVPCFNLRFQGNVLDVAVLFCMPLHPATTRAFWCMCLSTTYQPRSIPKGAHGSCGSTPTWPWSCMVLVKLERPANMAV